MGTGSGPGRGSGLRIAPTTSPRWPGSWAWAGSPPWVIRWAAWSLSCCTGGTPRCCRVWCCAPPRAARRGHRRNGWLPWRCRRRPPPRGGTRCCGWPAPSCSAWRCWAPLTTRPQPAGPRPAAPDPAGHGYLGEPGRLRVQLGRLDRPGRRPHRGGGHHPGPPRAGQPSAEAGPGGPGRIGARGRRRSRSVHHRAADVGPGAAPGMLAGDSGIFDMGGVGVDVVHGRGDPGTTQGLLDRDQVDPAQVKLGGIRNAAAHAA